ncbi:MAG: mechanosensitive ion channel domain-containing protein [Synechocystis sp.]|nr:mechanosensitive ion channel domain-containing protein [Synechocystis sp.]
MFGVDQAAILNLVAGFAVKILSALIILIVGLWLSKKLQKLISRVLKKSNLEPTFIHFVSNFSYYLFLVILVLLFLSQLGIETTSLIAILGTASLAVGLALQGSLANLAAGILLVIFRYFRVGDRIEVGGIMGKVESIQILSTTLCTPDNRLVTIPNKQVIDSNIVNHVGKPIRRLDLVVGIAYEEDTDHVIAVIRDVLNHHRDVLDDPPAVVVIGELADSSVNFYVRPWIKSEDYLRLELELTEAIKRRLDQENITIPFPQRDIHVINSVAGLNN